MSKEKTQIDEKGKEEGGQRETKKKEKRSRTSSSVRSVEQKERETRNTCNEENRQNSFEPISISPSVQTGKFGFCMTFRLGSVRQLPPSLKGEVYMKWTRGSFSGKTESLYADAGKVIAWEEPQTIIVAFSLKKKGMDWESKSITFTLKQMKKGWGTAKDVGRLKLYLGDHVGDQDKIYNMTMSSCFSPPPSLEMSISSRTESQSFVDKSGRGSIEADDESEATAACDGEDFENKTWDTISLADLDDGAESNAPELRKKYDNLRRRAFQLRDAIIKWQNYANKLKENNNYLNNKVAELEKEKEKRSKEVSEVKNQIKDVEENYNQVLRDLENCKNELKNTLDSLSHEQHDKDALSNRLSKQDAEKSGLEEAKGHAMRVVEVYESQKVTLKNKEDEVDKLSKAIREKEDEIARLNQSLKTRVNTTQHSHSSLVPSIVGLLVLIFFGMLYKFMA